MKAWFFKGVPLWAEAIQFWTGLHAHMELEITPGLFFSSTLETGPRFTDFSALVSQDMADWDIIEIPATGADVQAVLALAKMMTIGITGQHQVYNRSGILRNFLKPQPLPEQQPDAAFCSQACVQALQSIGLFLNYAAFMVSPHEAYEVLQAELPRWGEVRFKVIEGA